MRTYEIWANLLNSRGEEVQSFQLIIEAKNKQEARRKAAKEMAARLSYEIEPVTYTGDKE